MSSLLPAPAILTDHPAYTDVGEALSQADTVFITAHVGPDGDTLGSMLGLKWALAQLPGGGPSRVDCVIAGTMPQVYGFLPGIESVKDVETATDLLETYDVAVSVDCGSLGRLGPSQTYFRKAKQALNIDHHVSNECFGTVNLVIPEAGASGEVIAYLLDSMGLPFTKEVATCLYVAILTDTGGFRFATTTPAIFRLCARLVEAGVEPEPVYKAIYEQLPMAQVLLHAEAVSQSIPELNGRLLWANVSRAQLQHFGAKDEHIEGLIDRLREVAGVEIAALFKETAKGDIKVSLRSNREHYNVAALLQQFGGGGHKMAAGANLAGTLEDANAALLPLLRQTLSG